MSYLHITNGDGAANIIKQSAVPGDVLPWRDPMHHGPFPGGLGLDAVSARRAAYLAGPDGDAGEVARDFRLRDTHLRAAGRYDHVVLWFEHDLLDQLQMLQLLDWFSGTDIGTTTLEVICINSFPGREEFRGIGELDAAQMASLFPGRQPVTQDALECAQAGWAAFCATTPLDLLGFLEGDLHPLPYLAAALLRHLEEYSSAQTGLTRTESQLLVLAGDGVHSPDGLFRANMDRESALYIGDWPTYAHIGSLCAAGLLACAEGAFHFPSFTAPERARFNDQRLHLSETGQAVLSGVRDAFDLMPRDMWLGGVHLRSDRPMWTWDAVQSCMLLRRP